MNSWQDKRTMTGQEYAAILARLGLSMAAGGRYLGVSGRTSRRYCQDLAEIPPAQVLLLRALLASGEAPIVPRWSRAWEKKQ